MQITEQAKYETMAKEKGFASILHMAASEEMPTWGKIEKKFIIIDIPVSHFISNMMSNEQRDLLEFLVSDGKISKEPAGFGNISYNQYVAGDKLSEIIRQEKSKCSGSCRKL